MYMGLDSLGLGMDVTKHNQSHARNTIPPNVPSGHPPPYHRYWARRFSAKSLVFFSAPVFWLAWRTNGARHKR